MFCTPVSWKSKYKQNADQNNGRGHKGSRCWVTFILQQQTILTGKTFYLHRTCFMALCLFIDWCNCSCQTLISRLVIYFLCWTYGLCEPIKILNLGSTINASMFWSAINGGVLLKWHLCAILKLVNLISDISIYILSCGAFKEDVNLYLSVLPVERFAAH